MQKRPICESITHESLMDWGKKDLLTAGGRISSASLCRTSPSENKNWVS